MMRAPRHDDLHIVLIPTRYTTSNERYCLLDSGLRKLSVACTGGAAGAVVGVGEVWVPDPLVRPAAVSRICVGSLSAGAMLALVGMLAWGHDPIVSRALLDPGAWWYVARASGLVAWVLLSVSVVGGLLMGTRLTQGSARLWTQGLHEFVGALAVVFTAIHLVSVLSDSQLRIGVPQLLVPFARPTNPVAQGCGVIAFYLLTSPASPPVGAPLSRSSCGGANASSTCPPTAPSCKRSAM
jgi:hypothetical protein